MDKCMRITSRLDGFLIVLEQLRGSDLTIAICSYTRS